MKFLFSNPAKKLDFLNGVTYLPNCVHDSEHRLHLKERSFDSRGYWSDVSCSPSYVIPHKE